MSSRGLSRIVAIASCSPYGRLLGRVSTNTHFVVVWDCDAAVARPQPCAVNCPVVPRSRRLHSLHGRNKFARNGIENNYDEEILEPYSTTTMSNDGTLLGHGFQSNRKAEFANDVLRQGTSQYFTHFQELHRIVSEILGAA